MSNAQVVIGHILLNKTVTMEIDRDFLTRAKAVGHAPSQNALVMQFKRLYESTHKTKINGFISWRGLRIEETEESKQRPQGCGCECRGCDENIYHCHKQDRDCHL